MDVIIDFLSQCVSAVFWVVDFCNAVVSFVVANSIWHPAVWGSVLGFALVLFITLYLIGKHQSSIIRVKSKSQKMYLGESNALYLKAAKTTESPAEILEWAKGRRYMNGWAFELFVMKAMAKRLPDVIFMGDVKLTGDAGFDGILVTQSKKIFFLQSKFYSNYLTKQTFTQLASNVEAFNKRKAKNNWHKVLGIPKKFNRNLDYTGYPVVAYTGKISEQNIQLAKSLNVELVDWNDLISYVRPAEANSRKIENNAATALQTKSQAS